MGLQVYLTIVEYEDDENGDTISVESDVFGKEISHELRFMADTVSVFDAVWSPSWNGFLAARKIVPYLEFGVSFMESKKEYVVGPSKEDSENYDKLLLFLKEYRSACEKYPDAKIDVVW